MRKFIHNVALMASLIALAVGLWQDWGVWLTLKRTLISYMGFFCGSSLVLVIWAISHQVGNPGIPAANRTADRRPNT